jgi:hypothetical protein
MNNETAWGAGALTLPCPDTRDKIMSTLNFERGMFHTI